MTAVSIPRPIAISPAASLLFAGIGLSLALLPPSLLALVIDDRTLHGATVWAKPIKFQLSLAMLMATLVLLLPLIAPDRRDGRTVRWAAGAVVIASTLEVLYITLQAARGTASHYADGSDLERTLYSLMGLGAFTIVAGCFVIGLVILRSPAGRHGPGLRLGGGLGLVLGAVTTLVTAFVLASGVDGPGPWVGGTRSLADGLPLVGWSTTGGDLRVPHFFATHLMQAVPVAGLLADRWRPAAARRIVGLTATVGVMVVVATFLQAMAGRPFLG
jgi:hypothetical protein